MRVGPYTYRLDVEGSHEQTLAITDVGIAPGTIVGRATSQELDALAERRLALLMDGAQAMHQAGTETQWAEAIVTLALAGTGFHRVVVLRHGRDDHPEVIAFQDQHNPNGSVFGFSRSIVREAGAGHVVRLTKTESMPLDCSIGSLCIHSAVCCPIVIDNSVTGYVYLDSRGAEEQPYPDAVGFCHAVARLASLCIANQKRADLQLRQVMLDKELKAARDAQAFLTPAEEGVVGGLSYKFRTLPGRFLAGDLFDIFELDDGKVGICFGDVCGHGLGSAVLMTAILSHLRSVMTLHGEPVAATTNINRYLIERSNYETFASLFVGMFDSRTGVLQFVDAGHGHWLIKRKDRPPEPGPMPQHLIIGVDPECAYAARELQFSRGDRFLIYSDGVTERTGEDNEEFGQQRLIDAIAGAHSPNEDMASALDAMQLFVGRRGVEDDTTLVSLAIEG
jgi:serine phosphatase RsbU (regulator of sigma subunit)